MARPERRNWLNGVAGSQMEFVVRANVTGVSFIGEQRLQTPEAEFDRALASLLALSEPCISSVEVRRRDSWGRDFTFVHDARWDHYLPAFPDPLAGADVHAIAGLGSDGLKLVHLTSTTSNVLVGSNETWHATVETFPYSDIADVLAADLVRADALSAVLHLLTQPELGEGRKVWVDWSEGAAWPMEGEVEQQFRTITAALRQQNDTTYRCAVRWAEDGRSLLTAVLGLQIKMRSSGRVIYVESPFATIVELHRELVERVANSLIEASIPEVPQHRTCPWCAEEIKSAARLCKHCGSEVLPLAESAGSDPASEAAAADMPQAGWFPDPAGEANLRWWDGLQWTNHTHTGAPSASDG